MISPANKIERIKSTLQIKEEINQHIAGWKIQRMGWVFIFGIMLLALLGLFGEGILSNETKKSGDITTQYDRFIRYDSETKVLIVSNSAHMATVSLPQDYLKKLRSIRIIPEPDANDMSTDYVNYNFKGSENKMIAIYLVPKAYGNIDATMLINGMDRIVLHHFIYP